MKIHLSKILIKLYAIAVAVSGLYIFAFFFPNSKGCNNFISCILFSICGFMFFLIGIGLFFLKNFSRKIMIFLSVIFVVTYIYGVIIDLKTDFTGQGLIIFVLILPMFLICFWGIILLLLPKIRKEF